MWRVKKCAGRFIGWGLVGIRSWISFVLLGAAGAGFGLGVFLARRIAVPELLWLLGFTTVFFLVLFSYLLFTIVLVRPLTELQRVAARIPEQSAHRFIAPSGTTEVRDLTATLNDVGERIVSQQLDLRKQLAKLQQAQEQLIRSERLASVGRVAAAIAHEVGNPLAAIGAMMELASDPSTSPAERTQFIRRTINETDRIHRVIQGLLDYARADEEVRLEPTSLAPCIREALALAEPLPIMRGVDATVENVDHTVLTDHDSLKQVLFNVIVNAAQALAAGDISDPRIRVHAVTVGAKVELHVEDNGPGFPFELSDDPFEPFVTTKPAGQGTGLGLAVSRTIMTRLHGAITAEPSSQGAHIQIALPPAE